MNLKHICRICLRIPKKSINLFEKDAILVEKIKLISSVQIEYRNELSENICEECFAKINQFYNFKKVIVNTDYDLSARLETLKQTNNVEKRRTQNEYVKTELTNNNRIQVVQHENPIRKKTYTTRRIQTYRNQKGISKCPYCGRICNSSSHLSSHKITYHIPKSICDICGLTVQYKNLNRHMQIHLGEPIPCKQCGKVLKHSESMKSHILQQHFEQSSCCEICGRIYKNRSKYWQHIKRHKDPNYGKKKCPVCQKLVDGLKKHMLSHTGAKPFICSYCKKGFITAYKLKLHTRLHTNERPCKCEHCPNAFTSPWLLKRHLNSKHRISNDNVQSS